MIPIKKIKNREAYELNNSHFSFHQTDVFALDNDLYKFTDFSTEQAISFLYRFFNASSLCST